MGVADDVILHQGGHQTWVAAAGLAGRHELEGVVVDVPLGAAEVRGRLTHTPCGRSDELQLVAHERVGFDPRPLRADQVCPDTEEQRRHRGLVVQQLFCQLVPRAVAIAPAGMQALVDQIVVLGAGETAVVHRAAGGVQAREGLRMRVVPLPSIQGEVEVVSAHDAAEPLIHRHARDLDVHTQTLLPLAGHLRSHIRLSTTLRAVEKLDARELLEPLIRRFVLTVSTADHQHRGAKRHEKSQVLHRYSSSYLSFLRSSRDLVSRDPAPGD